VGILLWAALVTHFHVLESSHASFFCGTFYVLSLSFLVVATMVEPFSLAVNVVQIICACTATIKTSDHLIKQYSNAAEKLESLASEAELVKATLNQLDKVLTGNSSYFARKVDNDLDLKAAIDRTLTGCWTVFLLLHKELGKLLPKAGKDTNFIQKAGLLFNDEIIQDYRSQIRGHVQGLESVLVCLQA
jgi:hypothetical protein